MIKRRHQLGPFQNIIQELIVEDRYTFKDMFWMSMEDFESVLMHIVDLISPQEIQRGNRPVLSDERLALSLKFLATGESFQSFNVSFQELLFLTLLKVVLTLLLKIWHQYFYPCPRLLINDTR